MGFRSTFVSEHGVIDWPDWFIERWGESVHIADGLLSSRWEAKTYGPISDLPADIQRVLREVNRDRFVMVWLHECDGITRTEITRDSIRHTDPIEWTDAGTPTGNHWYCYGCSDAEKVPSHQTDAATSTGFKASA